MEVSRALVASTHMLQTFYTVILNNVEGGTPQCEHFSFTFEGKAFKI